MQCESTLLLAYVQNLAFSLCSKLINALITHQRKKVVCQEWQSDARGRENSYVNPVSRVRRTHNESSRFM